LLPRLSAPLDELRKLNEGSIRGPRLNGVLVTLRFDARPLYSIQETLLTSSAEQYLLRVKIAWLLRRAIAQKFLVFSLRPCASAIAVWPET
jgi:hypothetical protein